jgi:alcohol dehydrogenase (cytochrome c)
VDLAQPRATTPDALKELIRKGIPDAGMPAFPISDSELTLIAGYIAALRAPAGDHPVAGDAVVGKSFFEGKGKCSSCHMVNGNGGLLGPDLSNLARQRKLGQIEQVLREPGSLQAAGGRGGAGGGRRGGGPTAYAATVHLRSGQNIHGLVKNESPFDMQVQGADGRLYLLNREQVTSVARDTGSIMPKVTATPDEMRNLLAYLTRLTPAGNGGTIAGTAKMGEGLSWNDIAHPKPGTWPTYHGDIGGNRFSSLDQINSSNVSELAPKWMFPVTAPRALEVTPLVVDGVMYVTTVNEAWALDARSGRQIWHYNRPRTPGVIGDAASGINRGVALLGDRVFMVTDNAHLIALHRLTGQLLWDVEMADFHKHYGSTSAPLVVKDLVIAGVSGGDEGIRGMLAAYKASTGELAWRFWTIPAPGEPGSETWSGRAAEHGCAATWLTGTYSPEDDIVYWPTGNPCPDYNGDERKGDNLYSSSVLALVPETGKLKWYYQFTPHDLHDWDATESPVVVDANFHGSPRKLLLQANRNGFFYVLDRTNGKVLLAQPFVKNLTWASGIGADGRPVLLPGYEPTPDGSRTCPSVSGAANWPSTAYNPSTGLYYVLGAESCNVYTKNDQWWEQGKSFYGGGTRRGGTDVSTRVFFAIDIQTGKVAWQLPDAGGGALGSGLMATAGGLVFYGDASGALIAADAKTGKLVWHFNAGQQWKAAPMTYTLDGTQYIAVAAGNTILAFTLR